MDARTGPTPTLDGFDRDMQQGCLDQAKVKSANPENKTNFGSVWTSMLMGRGQKIVHFACERFFCVSTSCA